MTEDFADALASYEAADPDGRPLARVMRPVVWCRPGDRVRDVAARIGDAGGSCAVLRADDGLGIVTDHDFRRALAAGPLDGDAPVSGLATVPALTVADEASRATGLLRMVEHGVHHLVVTDPDGRVVGVVRAVDLAQADVRDPLVVRSAVDAADSLDALASAYSGLPGMLVDLRARGMPARHVGAVRAAVMEAAVRRILALRADAAPAGVRTSWIVLGSLARREPLPRSDVDTALLWADPPDGADDPADGLRAYAGLILEDLRRCGLSPCPNGANADNPLFSRSQAAWAAAARGWLRDPTHVGALLLSAMVADSRPVTNVELGGHLTDTIRSHTRTAQFLQALLVEALRWRPPAGFVRDFVVHHTGEHRGQLDLKAGGLTPVVSIARWIAIATSDTRGGTARRLARGADAGLLTRDELDTLVGGFDHVYTLLHDHEARAEAADTYLDPRHLDRLARRHLRETFRAITVVQERAAREWLRRLTG
ncbi:putative nucleotidyltransferase substrate binding domain-containing protein [Luedemannella flava]